MAPERKCTHDESLAEVDIRAGEFLLYEVTLRGAQGKFLITDEENRIILSDSDRRKNGKWTAEWPPEGGWAWDGEDLHMFSGLMMLAESYRVRILHKSASGATRSILRDCKFEKKKDTDVAFEFLDVFVASEG